jgi:hypothetical protein
MIAYRQHLAESKYAKATKQRMFRGHSTIPNGLPTLLPPFSSHGIIPKANPNFLVSSYSRAFT